MSVASRLRHRVDVQRSTSVETDLGAVRRTYSTVRQAMPALIQDVGEVLRQRPFGERLEIEKRLFYRPEEDLRPDDRVVFEGDAYEVRAVLDPGGQGRVGQADLTKEGSA